MGSIYYHGTSKENSELILKNGFQPLTYFTWDLHSALVMGGMYIFGIYFDDKDISDYWEWRNTEIILPERILFFRKFSIDCIFDNEVEERKMREKFLIERHGNSVKYCSKCKGNGQLNELKPYEKNHDIIVCPKCGGFGCIKKNNKKLNEI